MGGFCECTNWCNLVGVLTGVVCVVVQKLDPLLWRVVTL